MLLYLLGSNLNFKVKLLESIIILRISSPGATPHEYGLRGLTHPENVSSVVRFNCLMSCLSFGQYQ